MNSLKGFLIQCVVPGTTGNTSAVRRLRKYPYLPQSEDWIFLGDRGFCKAKQFKEMHEAYLEFPEGCVCVCVGGGGGGSKKKSIP